MAREIGRVPAQRDTHYNIIKKFGDTDNTDEKLDDVAQEQFGSYVELVKIKKFRYENPRK